MAWLRAALALLVGGALAAAVVSGGSSADPRTPPALPGLPPPFLGTVVVGSGGLTAAIDAYGDVVDLRAPGPAGRALVENPAERQAAGTVAAGTGIVPRVRVGRGPALPFWRADSVTQEYLPGTNVVRTAARFGSATVVVVDAIAGGELARVISTAPAGMPVALSSVALSSVALSFEADVAAALECEERRGPGQAALACAVGGPPAPGDARKLIAAAVSSDRRWVAAAEPLGQSAPGWAVRMYQRSLLVLRALTDRRAGAVAAGARDGWSYVWPRDAGAVALAFAAAGYRTEARRVARFLLGLDLDAAARFHDDGKPVPGRAAQGDVAGWATVAGRAAGIDGPKTHLYRGKSAGQPAGTQSGSGSPFPVATFSAWRNRADYQEGDSGDYLANAIATDLAAGGPISPPGRNSSALRPGVGGIADGFGTSRGLVRRAGDAGSGLDSAAAWAVRPFSLPALFPAVQRTLLHLAADQTRFGITPGEAWPGVDPWTAPTAWTAWSLAALSDRAQSRGALATAARDRGAALRLLAALRRAAAPAGALPERVGVRSGVPRSTTPLAWSHAFAILALRELWP